MKRTNVDVVKDQLVELLEQPSKDAKALADKILYLIRAEMYRQRNGR